jgi:hypothetical protein
MKLSVILLAATAFAETLTVSMAEWQALGEDVHSIVADPLFVDPSYPADDFRLRPDSPATKIGFVPFDPNQAGRTQTATIRVPPIPPAFPVLLLDPEKEYYQPSSATRR